MTSACSAVLVRAWSTVRSATPVLAFDHLRSGPLPAPDPYLERFTDKAFARLAEAGADCVHIVDISLKSDDNKPFVVEWKNLTSGSLAVPGQVLSQVADCMQFGLFAPKVAHGSSSSLSGRVR
jgi:hypothetical protein